MKQQSTKYFQSILPYYLICEQRKIETHYSLMRWDEKKSSSSSKTNPSFNQKKTGNNNIFEICDALCCNTSNCLHSTHNELNITYLWVTSKRYDDRRQTTIVVNFRLLLLNKLSERAREPSTKLSLVSVSHFIHVTVIIINESYCWDGWWLYSANA